MEKFGIQNRTLVSFLIVLFLFICSNCFAWSQNDDVSEVSGTEQKWVRVGLVLDLGSVEGKIVGSSVSLALSDFYTVNSNYRTRIILSVRNSHGEPILALASAIDLLQTEGVKAIIGGNSLLETKLLAEIGEKARIPVISLNSPVSLSLSKYSHLIQATYDSSSEAKGITAFIHEFDWKSVALVHEDEDDWRESMQLLVDHFHENGVHIRSKVGFTVSSTEEVMMDRLRKLKDLRTTVFVVHLSELIATHLFPCAEKLGMMSEGFAWILTVKSMNSFNQNLDDFSKQAMEGVVGFRSYIPMSKKLHNFTSKWRKSLPVEEDAGSEIARLSIPGVWAHDVAWALARAAEFTRMSNVSSTLLEAITECRFKGLSGDFRIKNKKLLSNKFEIVNLIGSGERRVGLWNSNGSFSNKLETIFWPGGTIQNPQGLQLGESKRKTLRVLVTSSNRFPKLVNATTDPRTKKITADGFCIQVFNASIRRFNYDVEYTLWTGGPNYDNLAYTLSTQKDKYDAAVGDITITSNRSNYVDFTIPFTELGLGMVAPKQSSMWVFFQPLTLDLWMTSAAFFVLTGTIVWLIERPENTEFQGSWSQQIGVMLWFGFSTLVYAHREKLKHNLSRFVVTVWVFAVLILTTSYTATLTSMMTVQQIRFNTNKDFVGHLSGSLIANETLKAMNTKGLNTSEDYAKALLNNTVAFIIDELPYLSVLLGENPGRFLMIKPQVTTNGFGFMFQKGDELVHNVSKEISELRTKGRLNEMAKTWFENRFPYTIDDTPDPIDLYRFRGLFMITGGSSALALAVVLIIWLRDTWGDLMNSISIFLAGGFIHFRILFARTVSPSPVDEPIGENAMQMAQHVDRVPSLSILLSGLDSSSLAAVFSQNVKDRAKGVAEEWNPLLATLDMNAGNVSVSEQERVRVRVGMVLNLGSLEGTIVETSVSLALSDFYAVNSDYKTRVSLSVRNSQGEPLLALASAVELLQTVGVEAIIGGDSLQETKLLAEIGEKAKVPVISLNSPVSLSLRKYSHLIQATHDTFSEAKGITAFIHEFDWKSVALVYDEDEDGWRESMQLMVDHFHENGVHIQSKVGFTVSSTEEVMMDRLRKLKDLGTTVFVVHLSELVATHLFPCAEKLGMMSEGFAWILTAKTMNSFHGNNGDEYAKEAMEGVVGFKTYIPMSKELQNFTSRWRQSLPVEEAIGSEITRLSIFGIWAHDVAWALARAAEVTRMPDASSTLLEAITQCSFKGLSGNFQIKDKNFLSDKFEIVNLIGSGERRVGFWSSNGSFSSRRHLSSFTDNKLDTIIWPGVSSQSPKGHKLGESKRKTLRVLVTSSNRFPKLVSWRTDPVTKKIIADGFCIQVFNASIRRFNYDVEYTLWTGGPNYDDLAYTLSSQKDKYDMAVGDITITSNRSSYVDFTIPFTELGLGMVAPKQSGMWVFFQPLTPDLWMTSAAFFVLTGIIVWLIEKPENKEFQGSWSQQIGVMLWFGFSTLVYAHREKLKHNLSRFVVTVWVFAVLILTTSYTATLTSMMTVQQIRFNSNKDFIGHLSGSLIANASLASTNINATNVRGLINSTDYAKALLNNSVAFIIDELPYLNVLLGEKPDHFLMVKPQITTNGFGFMFQKGDELVHLVSKEISELRTKGRLNEMSKTWFDNRLPYIIDDTSEPIDLYRFRGLFMITGGSSAFALAVLLIIWIRDRWEYLMSSINIFLSRRLVHFRIFFARTIHPSPLDDLFVENAVQMAQLNR
ncbi:unnamed protein product [Brassica napus]|uniref:(rape) hypothetical protein n=1 Tax=Brassica napus TaxID=3708 RepID=A0A816X995_BRANA|nr:unnamed protein product [Brassica napus]